MRMRVKPWARPELAVSPFYVEKAEEMRGHWCDAFQVQRPLYVELGCGKGVSTCQMALADEEHNYVAIDLITSVLGVARRNAEAAYRGRRPVDNLVFSNFDIEYSVNFFAPEDSVQRIYISFCNPWTKRRTQNKHRLTYPRQLVQYRTFLADGGEIHFKTDDDELFEDSRGYFRDSGFEETYVTYDLHQSSYTPNYESEHEKMFAAEGIKIKFLIARKKPDSEWQAPDDEAFRIPYRPQRGDVKRLKRTKQANAVLLNDADAEMLKSAAGTLLKPDANVLVIGDSRAGGSVLHRVREMFLKAGMPLRNMAYCDAGNEGLAGKLGAYDAVLIADGDAALQNAFLIKLKLKEKLGDYEGLVIAWGSGAANSSVRLYAADGSASRFLPGLGLARTTVVPECTEARADSVLADSAEKEFFCLNKGGCVVVRDGEASFMGNVRVIKNGVYAQ